ncbi:hypothetical protein SteCoe_2122 [Stentor coeruleus]|uniref:Uncharacterized protein n=1 Tax=Stentor coeruleus TaxID=5963 RepID=A0A1R2D058_9CILI|nr:hypothetical protein SteCoe_2122 [Stentor coeruleus]
MSSQIKKKFKESSMFSMSNAYDCSRQLDSEFTLIQNDDEIKEITLQLVMIRKAYDNILRENSQKRSQIEMMKKQIEKLSSTTNICNEDQSSISAKMLSLTNQVGTLKSKLDEELKSNRIYEQILSRMKTETISLELRSSNLHTNLSSANRNLDGYMRNNKMKKEDNVQSQKLLKTIREEIEAEKKSNDDMIKRLEKSARAKKEAAIRRQERIKKQAEIAEKAANENRNAKEIALKQEIILHKLYHMFLKYKQDKLSKESKETEEAFMSIKIATGLSNIKSIVEGFLKKEEVTAQLKSTMAESEKNLDLYKKKHEKTKNELSQVVLMSSESLGPYLQKFTELEFEISNERKIYSQFEEEKNSYEELYRRIEDLRNKFSRILGVKQDKDLFVSFDYIKEGVRKNLEEIQNFKDMYMKQYEKEIQKSTLDLFKSMYPLRVAKPKFIHDEGYGEELQEFRTPDGD